MNIEDFSLEKLENMSPAVLLLTVLVTVGTIMLVFKVKLMWVVLLQFVAAVALYPLIVGVGDMHHEVRNPEVLRCLRGCFIGLTAFGMLLASSVSIGWIRKRRQALEAPTPTTP
jgi:hypothetical protein